jgi:hypothetical protein
MVFCAVRVIMTNTPSMATLMSRLAKPPVFKPFSLALVQLGGVGANKSDNLKHAREMILKTAGSGRKPDLIVLPVRSCILL